MNNPEQIFSDFLIKGELVKYDKTIDSYTFKLSTDFSDECDLIVVEEALRQVNTSSNVKLEERYIVFNFVASSESWTDGFKAFLYRDINSFFRSCIKRRAIPEKYCILDRKLTNRNSDQLILKKIASVTRWTKLLSEMADHCPNNKVFVFFVHYKEGKTKAHELSPYIDVSDIENLTLDCDDGRFKHLFDSWNLKDAHEKERQSVMLVSFAEIMSLLKDEQNPFKLFLSSTKKFHDRYRENYDIYVNRFSVDNQLREIDEQHLGFVGTLQDLVTSSQTKAFAIPGVMVAIGALAKTSNFLSVFAIGVGVIMTKILILKSNELLKESLTHFKDTVDKALGEYVKSRKEAEEVRLHATEAQKKLDKQIRKANARVDFIDTLANWMLFIGLLLSLYMAYEAMIKAEPEKVASAIEWCREVSKTCIDWVKSIY